ncbi:MAG TPA: hypothetical protein VHJ17_10165, partial [Thermomonospora sp.]|nr:hypothetical protein [Thermomonospora sp.]
GPRARRTIPRHAGGPSRRSVLGGVMSAGFGLGMAALGVFPAARQARADEAYDEYYEIKRLPCPSYASWHDCSPGCGPSQVCASCCRTSGPRKGFHHSSVSKPNHKLRPNKCFGGWADGWLWRWNGRCGECANSRTFRCHDGWRRSSRTSPYYRTICKWTTACR